MTSATRTPARFSVPLVGLLALLLCLLLLSAGCAQRGTVATAPTAEPITDSDEPEARKRARIRIELAAGYFGEGQNTVALDEIKLALLADPTYAPAYVLRGLVYMGMNNDPLAEESFQRAMQLNPRDPDALHNYGWYACQRGRYAQSTELFQRALASPVYGGQARSLLAMGICQIRAGQLVEAEASLARSYELDPANPIVAYNLASLQFRRGEDSKAQFTIRRLNNTNLANAETLWLGIKVERRLRNREAMAQLAQQLGRRYPDSAQWARFQRGEFDE